MKEEETKEEQTQLDTTIILHTYPARISIREAEETKEQKIIDDLKDTQDRIKKTFEYNILDDSSKEEWKDKLSNQKKRDQELSNRLSECKDYQDLLTSIPKKTIELDEFRRKTRRMLREWQSAKALARLHGG